VYGRLSRVVQSNPDYQDLYEDVQIETRQATEMCSIYRDILKTTMDAFSSVISNNVNDVVKRLTIITILVSIPTLIAGLLGMNVDLPFGIGGDGGFIGWQFWLVSGICLVLTVICAIVLYKVTDSVKIRTPKEVKKKRRKK
jgi:magnesium transporter